MKNSKLMGALISGGIIVAYLVMVVTCFVYAQYISFDKLPIGMFICLLGFICLPIIGILVALLLRVKEINTGEEEEAKKY